MRWNEWKAKVDRQEYDRYYSKFTAADKANAPINSQRIFGARDNYGWRSS